MESSYQLPLFSYEGDEVLPTMLLPEKTFSIRTFKEMRCSLLRNDDYRLYIFSSPTEYLHAQPSFLYIGESMNPQKRVSEHLGFYELYAVKKDKLAIGEEIEHIGNAVNTWNISFLTLFEAKPYILKGLYDYYQDLYYPNQFISMKFHNSIMCYVNNQLRTYSELCRVSKSGDQEKEREAQKFAEDILIYNLQPKFNSQNHSFRHMKSNRRQSSFSKSSQNMQRTA